MKRPQPVAQGGFLGGRQRPHQVVGPPQPRLLFLRDRAAQALDHRRRRALDRVIDGLVIGGEVGRGGSVAVTGPRHLATGHVQRRGVAHQVDDRRAETRHVEVLQAEALARHHELLEVRVAVDGHRRQPPAQVAEFAAGPRRRGPRQQAEVAKGARGHPIDERRRCSLGAQRGLVDAEARRIAGRHVASAGACAAGCREPGRAHCRPDQRAPSGAGRGARWPGHRGAGSAANAGQHSAAGRTRCRGPFAVPPMRTAGRSGYTPSCCDSRTFRPIPHRLPARRRRAHRAVQLAPRPPRRRRVRAAHRGHRRRAILGRDGRRHPAGDALARHELGRRARRRRRARTVLPVAALRSAPRRRRRSSSPPATPTTTSRRPRSTTRRARPPRRAARCGATSAPSGRCPRRRRASWPRTARRERSASRCPRAGRRSPTSSRDRSSSTTR